MDYLNQNQQYNQIIHQLQSISDKPIYFTLVNHQIPYQDSEYEICLKLANNNLIQSKLVNESTVDMTSNQLIKYSITNEGSQILGQCKYLNAKIDSERAVAQEYVRQQKYCLWLILVPILLFGATYVFHISTYFMILSIVLMFFIFALAIVNSLHYKDALFQSKKYLSQIPSILGNNSNLNDNLAVNE